MVKINPIEFELIKKDTIRKLSKEECENNISDKITDYSFSVKIPSKGIDVFNRPLGSFSGFAKKILYIYKGRVVNTAVWMEGYNLGEGWVKVEGFPLKDEKEFNQLKSRLEIYRY